MDYFLLKQDKRYKNVPVLKDVQKSIDFRNINLLNAHKIEDVTTLYVNGDENTSYLDVLDDKLYLISEDLQEILQKYAPAAIFKMVFLIDFDHDQQGNYYLPIFEEVEALSEESEFNLDKSVIKKLVLDAEKIKGKKIFKIKESDKTLIVVRLDVAESILRRDFEGICLERVEAI